MPISVSIISHGHLEMLVQLLQDLNAYSGTERLEVYLTINAPGLEGFPLADLVGICRWPVKTILNGTPKGFGANHNAALALAEPGLWCVMNPDVRLPSARLEALVSALGTNEQIALCFPRQVSPKGEALEYRRDLVTPWSLVKRYLGRRRENGVSLDWVSGCFMAFRSEVFGQLGGFDERYFLYGEDVDICLRLQLAGYKMAEADLSIVHDTRRNTLKNWDHFNWHLASLLKLWCSRVFWRYLRNRHRIGLA